MARRCGTPRNPWPATAQTDAQAFVALIKILFLLNISDFMPDGRIIFKGG